MAAGRDLPHDLMQFTIERALEIRDGFWGILAHGGWFASVPRLLAETVTMRRSYQASEAGTWCICSCNECETFAAERD